MREIAPKEISGLIVILNPIAILVGALCADLAAYADKGYPGVLEAFGFAFPALLAVTQLLLLRLVFRADSPKVLCVSSRYLECLSELSKIYTSVDRRTEEFTAVQQLANQVSNSNSHDRRGSSRRATASCSSGRCWGTRLRGSS